MFSGKSYAAGDAFPHEEMKLHATELSGLWRAELIEFQVPATDAATPVPSQPAKQQKHRNERR